MKSEEEIKQMINHMNEEAVIDMKSDKQQEAVDKILFVKGLQWVLDL